MSKQQENVQNANDNGIEQQNQNIYIEMSSEFLFHIFCSHFFFLDFDWKEFSAPINSLFFSLLDVSSSFSFLLKTHFSAAFVAFASRCKQIESRRQGKPERMTKTKELLPARFRVCNWITASAMCQCKQLQRMKRKGKTAVGLTLTKEAFFLEHEIDGRRWTTIGGVLLHFVSQNFEIFFCFDFRLLSLLRGRRQNCVRFVVAKSTNMSTSISNGINQTKICLLFVDSFPWKRKSSPFTKLVHSVARPNDCRFYLIAFILHSHIWWKNALKCLLPRSLRNDFLQLQQCWCNRQRENEQRKQRENCIKVGIAFIFITAFFRLRNAHRQSQFHCCFTFKCRVLSCHRRWFVLFAVVECT